MKKCSVRRILAIVAFPLLLAAVLVPVVVWHDQVWKLFTSGPRLREWIAARGAWAPLAFVGLQVFHVVVFVLPGEISQIAGGYLFGVWQGTLLSIAGIIPGSAIDFGLARALGRPFVATLFRPEKVEAIEALLASRSARIVFFLLFLIPGIPKDFLCYVAGITPLRLGYFLAVSLLGRIPGIVGSSLIGDAAASERWVLTGIVSGAAIILFAAGLILRPRLQALIERLAGRGRAPARGAATESSRRPRSARRTPRPS